MPERGASQRCRTTAPTEPPTVARRRKGGSAPGPRLRPAASASPTPNGPATRPPAGRQATKVRTSVRSPFDLTADERHERFTLIEFVWDIASGIQPVILAERTLLH